MVTHQFCRTIATFPGRKRKLHQFQENLRTTGQGRTMNWRSTDHSAPCLRFWTPVSASWCRPPLLKASTWHPPLGVPARALPPQIYRKTTRKRNVVETSHCQIV
ncbi:hypothetical protein JZ751_005979, partial [Albula glossodonta]